MAKTYPHIQNYIRVTPKEFPGELYLRVAGNSSIQGITILYADPILFSREGVINPEEGEYKLILAVQKGQTATSFTEIKQTIEELAEIMNAAQ